MLDKGTDVIAMSRQRKQGDEPMILMVGDPNKLQSTKPYYPKSSGVFFIEFADLTREVLIAINPNVVMSPAICEHFDCLDVAQFLEKNAFSGAYRVIDNDLPRPEIVGREVRFNHPSVDFGFVRKPVALAEHLN